MDFPDHVRAPLCWIIVAAACLLTAGCASPRATPSQPAVADQVVRAVCHDRIVLLGELPSHGEAVAFQLKARIAQRLVEQCGFDGVLFEAPIYDFLGFQEGVGQGQATPSQLDDAIGGFWSNVELEGWRRWLFDRARAGELLVGGIDDQLSATSSHARRVLPSLIADNVPTGMAAACKAAVSRHLGWTYDNDHPFDHAEQETLLQCATIAHGKVASAGGADVAREMVENFFRYIARTSGADGAVPRDESMYRNVTWYLDRLPAHARVVVWTASVHAARTQGALPYEPLGARLVAKYGDGVASISFSAVGGTSSMAGAPPRPLEPVAASSLEARALASGDTLRYLDKDALRALGAAQSRLLGHFAVEDWSGYFDGVVVVRNEVAPHFELHQPTASP